MNNMLEELFTIEQLAAYLHMSEKTILNRMTTNKPLPPSFKLPDSRTRLWRVRDVDEWVNSVADAAIEREKQREKDFQDMVSIVKRGRPPKMRKVG